MLTIRAAEDLDRQVIAEIITERWDSPLVVSRGVIHDTATLPALIAEHDSAIVGLLTYRVTDGETEVVTVDALEPSRGIGTALVAELVERGRLAGWRRLWLITTNDNMEALRFYQRHGWDLVALHRNALEDARRLKPEIPELGAEHIPIRHELELEFPL